MRKLMKAPGDTGFILLREVSVVMGFCLFDGCGPLGRLQFDDSKCCCMCILLNLRTPHVGPRSLCPGCAMGSSTFFSDAYCRAAPGDGPPTSGPRGVPEVNVEVVGPSLIHASISFLKVKLSRGKPVGPPTGCFVAHLSSG